MLKRETIFAGEGGLIYKKDVNSPNPTRVEEEAEDRLARGRGRGWNRPTLDLPWN